MARPTRPSDRVRDLVLPARTEDLPRAATSASPGRPVCRRGRRAPGGGRGTRGQDAPNTGGHRSVGGVRDDAHMTSAPEVGGVRDDSRVPSPPESEGAGSPESPPPKTPPAGPRPVRRPRALLAALTGFLAVL